MTFRPAYYDRRREDEIISEIVIDCLRYGESQKMWIGLPNRVLKKLDKVNIAPSLHLKRISRGVCCNVCVRDDHREYHVDDLWLMAKRIRELDEEILNLKKEKQKIIDYVSRSWIYISKKKLLAFLYS